MIRRTPASVAGVRNSRRLRHCALAAVSAAAVALTAACGGGGSGADGDTTLQVGILTAETGPLAGAGDAFLGGAEIAAELVNEKDYIGGGKTIELEKRETSEDPARSASVASELAADPNIIGTICCILSPVAGAVKPVVQGEQVPTILYGATEPDLQEPPYVFRTTTMPQAANELLTNKIAEEKDISSAAYVVMTDNDGIVSQAESFKKGFDDAGVEDLGEVGILSEQTNFSSQATSAIQLGSDAIVVAATQAEAIDMIAALHDRGYDGLIISGETILGQGVYSSNPEALERVPFPGYFLPTDTTDLGEELADRYKEETGNAPDNFVAQGFNAVWVMATALKDAGESPTRETLTEALNNLTEVPDTVYGTVRFEGGQMFAEESVKIVHYSEPDGEVVPYEF